MQATQRLRDTRQGASLVPTNPDRALRVVASLALLLLMLIAVGVAATRMLF